MMRFIRLRKLGRLTGSSLKVFFSTIFLGTCVGALILAIISADKKLGDGYALVPPAPHPIIHIGDLTLQMREFDAAPSPGAGSASASWSLDISFLVPEYFQPSAGRSRQTGSSEPPEWERQISLSLLSGASGSAEQDASENDLDDLPSDEKSHHEIPPSVWRSDAVLEFNRCLSSSQQARPCRGALSLGGGLVVHYAMSRTMGKMADFRDRYDELLALLGITAQPYAQVSDRARLQLAMPREMAALSK